MMTRGRGGGWISPKSDDVIYEQPLTNSRNNKLKIKKVKTHLVTMKPICWITERDVKLGLGVN